MIFKRVSPARSMSALIGLVFLSTGCAETPTAAVQAEPVVPSIAIIASGAAEGDFHFLPPIGSKPGDETDFDGELDVVVNVCNASPCTTPHASFSLKDGTLAVDEVGGYYAAVWKTKATNAVDGMYSVRVSVGTQELGTANIVVVTPVKGRTSLPAGALAVTRGSAVPIKFYIKQGAVVTTPVLFQSRAWDLSNLPVQTGADYLSAITASMATLPTDGFCDKNLEKWQNVSNQSVCPSGRSSDFAFKITAKITVPAGRAGPYYVKLGADAARGVVWALDGTVKGFISSTSGDGPWSPTEVFSDQITLTEGTHTLVLAGIELCCDGAATSTISPDGATWSIIPELPSSMAGLQMAPLLRMAGDLRERATRRRGSSQY